MKKLPPELPIPFRMVDKQRIKLNRLGSQQRRKSILIYGHAQSCEPHPLISKRKAEASVDEKSKARKQKKISVSESSLLIFDKNFWQTLIFDHTV